MKVKENVFTVITQVDIIIVIKKVASYLVHNQYKKYGVFLHM